MIEETPIVQDTRKIRSDISEKFGNDFNQYIDFLQIKKTSKEAVGFHSLKVKDTQHVAQPDAR